MKKTLRKNRLSNRYTWSQVYTRDKSRRKGNFSSVSEVVTGSELSWTFNVDTAYVEGVGPYGSWFPNILHKQPAPVLGHWHHMKVACIPDTLEGHPATYIGMLTQCGTGQCCQIFGGTLNMEACSSAVSAKEPFLHSASTDKTGSTSAVKHK